MQNNIAYLYLVPVPTSIRNNFFQLKFNSSLIFTSIY